MYVLAVALSVLIGVVLGLLGGGGSILTTPILLYAMHLPAKEAIATSLVVVGTTSAAAVIAHARAGNVEWRTGLIFGGAGMAGAYAGGLFAGYIPDQVLLVLFAAMMLATAAAMFRGRKEGAAPRAQAPWKVVLLGLAVGSVTGLLGAGGGFVVVPALTLFGGLPMRKAVGTSLLVITLNTFAGYLGHASHVAIDPGLAASVSAAAVVGSVLGGRYAQRIAPEALRRGFAGFVLVMSVVVLSQQV